MHSSTRVKEVFREFSQMVILLNSASTILCLLLFPVDMNVPPLTERGISNSLVLLNVSSELSLSRELWLEHQKFECYQVECIQTMKMELHSKENKMKRINEKIRHKCSSSYL